MDHPHDEGPETNASQTPPATPITQVPVSTLEQLATSMMDLVRGIKGGTVQVIHGQHRVDEVSPPRPSKPTIQELRAQRLAAGTSATNHGLAEDQERQILRALSTGPEARRYKQKRQVKARTGYALKRITPATLAPTIRILETLPATFKAVVGFLRDHPNSTVHTIAANLDKEPKTIENVVYELNKLKLLDKIKL